MYNTQQLIASRIMFENQILIETQEKGILSDFQEDENVKKLIELGKKYFITKNFTEDDKEEVAKLVRIDNVTAYLETAEKVGKRNGWIYGGLWGGLLGGGAAGLGSAVLNLPVPAILILALLGAIVSGSLIGYIASKIMTVIQRWRTEDNMANNKQTNPIF